MKTNLKIINTDSRNLSRKISKESVHFIVTSPPYWNLRNYGYDDQIGFKQSYEDYLKDMKKVFKECFKVLKQGRFIAINIGTVVSNDGMKFITGDFVKICEDIGFIFRKDIIWHKPKGQTKWQRGATQFSQNPYPLKYNTNINHEFILVFQKGDSLDIDLSNVKRFNKFFVRKNAYSVWDIPPVNSPKKDEKHVAPFPEEIPRRLITLFSFENEIVLDPFAGCGTTNSVSLELGRKTIAVEMSKDYCDLIRKRTKNVTLDQSLMEIYDESEDFKEMLAKEKMDNLFNSYIKAKKKYEKILGDKEKAKYKNMELFDD